MVWYPPSMFLRMTHYGFCTYRLDSLDRKTTQLSQLRSIKHPIYALWAVLLLDHLVRHFAVSIRRWSSADFLPSDHQCLATIHKDGSERSKALPTTVSPLQLWSCRVGQVTDYEETISSFRWVVQVPCSVYRVRVQVSSIHILHYIFLYELGRDGGMHHMLLSYTLC